MNAIVPAGETPAFADRGKCKLKRSYIYIYYVTHNIIYDSVLTCTPLV